MSIKEAYNDWAQQYDANENTTRDLEAKALRELLSPFSFHCCLELGCGTGKNTAWLVPKCGSITAVDFSKEMLAKAKGKIELKTVEFVEADLNGEWTFAACEYDLITFSLVLEHIQNLHVIFEKAVSKMKCGGYMYIGELHPFKQYLGSKARFETAEGLKIVNCYTHHLSEFLLHSMQCGLTLINISEYFDEERTQDLPRVLAMLFQK
jgi:ubiquinone/menaquinone biosynthesis C-methylase UbiE